MQTPDLSQVAYRAPGGYTVRLAPSVDVGGLTVEVETRFGITTATLASDTPDAYMLDAATWTVDPPGAGYARADMLGPKAVFVPDADTSTLTVRVPITTGGTRVETVPVLKGTYGHEIGDLQVYSVTRGPKNIPVEAVFAFPEPGTYTAQLIRVASPGAATERTVITERETTFSGPTRCSETIPFPAGTGLGQGWEYQWEIIISPTQTVISDTIPIWIIGDDPACAPYDPATSPPIPRPDIFTREASKYGRVTPTSGFTYQDHLNAVLNQWKGVGFYSPGYEMGGAWMNLHQYNAVAYHVDLDDDTIPRYTIRHFDFWRAGYAGRGWYGLDTLAQPWPQDSIAVDVPVPHNAAPAAGTDRAFAIIGMRGGLVERIWEFWQARRHADGSWSAASIMHTTTARRWQASRGYTASASGLSIITGALLIPEAVQAVNYVRSERAAGRTPHENTIISYVNHPLCVAAPAPRSGVWSYPAVYSDGWGNATTDPVEGQLFYLRADADLNAANLTPLRHVIAVVMKRRGCLVTDKGGLQMALAFEDDLAYGGGIWNTLLEPDDFRDGWIDQAVRFPDDWFVVGKHYRSQAEYDADA